MLKLSSQVDSEQINDADADSQAVYALKYQVDQNEGDEEEGDTEAGTCYDYELPNDMN